MKLNQKLNLKIIIYPTFQSIKIINLQKYKPFVLIELIKSNVVGKVKVEVKGVKDEESRKKVDRVSTGYSL